jgi:hypothetical protein
LSQSNITVEVDENTGASTSSASSFELQALSNSQTENVLKNLLPDNDGFDDLINCTRVFVNFNSDITLGQNKKVDTVRQRIMLRDITSI